MKIGVLTYHAVANFGAQLQVLSTVSYLKNNGYTPIVINWYPEEEHYRKTTPVQQMKEHTEFVVKYIPVTRLCRNEDDIISVIDEENIQGIIIGSDAVLKHQTFWSRLRLTKKGIAFAKKADNMSYPSPFWGNFAKHIPLVMMSASSQNCPYLQIHNSLRRKMGESLSRFDYISVRDEWTQNMVKYLTKENISPEITPDPVFGFNVNVENIICTKEEILAKFGLPEKYILLSFGKFPGGVISTHWVNSFAKKAKAAGYSSVALCMPTGIKFKNNLEYKIDVPLSPLDWYALIKYAQGYVGHNMHPIIVSLHNAVPFFSFDIFGITKYKYFVNHKSSKIYHILDKAGLLQNRCSVAGRLSYQEPAPELVLNSILNFDRKKSKVFSDNQLIEYQKMMNHIEEIFNTNV